MSGEDRITIRNELRPGDIDRIIDLHRSIYRDEYGYGDDFIEYVIDTFDEYLKSHDEGSDRDRFWIVERKGDIAGSLAVVGRSADLAQLRWLLLHPDVRGRGIARRITAESLEFARDHGYVSIYLTTQDILNGAAGLYEHFGFIITDEKPVEMWGRKMVAQRYELSLKDLNSSSGDIPGPCRP